MFGRGQLLVGTWGSYDGSGPRALNGQAPDCSGMLLTMDVWRSCSGSEMRDAHGMVAPTVAPPDAAALRSFNGSNGKGVLWIDCVHHLPRRE